MSSPRAGPPPTERSPLLAGGAGKPRRESVVEYATHVPEDYAPVLDTPSRHYNLAGLSQTDFWLLVRPPAVPADAVYLDVVVRVPQRVRRDYRCDLGGPS
jgi:hypothetical protein